MATRGRTDRAGGRWRGPVALVLVVLCSLTVTLAVPAVWARRNFLDTERFTSRVAPAIEDPTVQAALSARLTRELMALVDPQALIEQALPARGQILAAPISAAVEGFVAERVELVLASEGFADLWARAVETTHAAATRVLREEGDVVVAGDEEIRLNLLPIIAEVLRDIVGTSPEVLGREIDLSRIAGNIDREVAVERLEAALGRELDDDFGQITVYDSGTLNIVQTGVRFADRLVVLLVALAVMLGALAVLSRRRRRTVLQLTAGVVLGMVLVRRGAFVLRDQVAALPPTDQGGDAATVVVDAFLVPLLDFARWVMLAAAVVAVVTVLTGSYGWAVALRRRTAAIFTGAAATARATATDDATTDWIGEHRDALLGAIGVACAVVLWSFDLSWVGLLVVLGGLGALALYVWRIAAPDAVAADPPR